MALPYAIENNMSAASFAVLRLSTPEFFINVNPTGIIIAVTVCSPINDDKNADIAIKPITIFQVLFPVSFIDSQCQTAVQSLTDYCNSQHKKTHDKKNGIAH
jgi:hypothetical protein